MQYPMGFLLISNLSFVLCCKYRKGGRVNKIFIRPPFVGTLGMSIS